MYTWLVCTIRESRYYIHTYVDGCRTTNYSFPALTILLIEEDGLQCLNFLLQKWILTSKHITRTFSSADGTEHSTGTTITGYNQIKICIGGQKTPPSQFLFPCSSKPSQKYKCSLPSCSTGSNSESSWSDIAFEQCLEAMPDCQVTPATPDNGKDNAYHILLAWIKLSLHYCHRLVQYRSKVIYAFLR